MTKFKLCAWLGSMFLGLAVLTSCSPPDPTPVAVNPFPQATEVRMYMHKETIQVDTKGHVTEGSFPAGGIPLTRAEIEDINGQALTYTVPPESVEVSMCCEPRHAFLFYDKSGRFLGSVTICFSCKCVVPQGFPAPPKNKDWMVWDEAAFERIVEAHGQPLHFKPEQ